MSGNEVIPPALQFFTNIGIAIGILVAIVTATFKITRSYGKLEEKINLLEGRIKRLEESTMFEWFKTWEKTKGVAAFYDDMLKSREVPDEGQG